MVNKILLFNCLVLLENYRIFLNFLQVLNLKFVAKKIGELKRKVRLRSGSWLRSWDQSFPSIQRPQESEKIQSQGSKEVNLLSYINTDLWPHLSHQPRRESEFLAHDGMVGSYLPWLITTSPDISTLALTGLATPELSCKPGTTRICQHSRTMAKGGPTLAEIRNLAHCRPVGGRCRAE